MTDRWLDLLAAQHNLPRVVLLRQLRTATHLSVAVTRLIAQDRHTEPADEPIVGDVRTGYLEAPFAQSVSAPAQPTTLADYDTNTAHRPREEQSAAERAKLDDQTNAVLRLLREQQQSE